MRFLRFRLIPVVHAKKEEPPKRPPLMRLEELNPYKNDHWAYKDYEIDKKKCKDYKKKLMQSSLLPYVKSTRKDMAESLEQSILKPFRDTRACIRSCFLKNKRDFLAYMRHPKNETFSKGVVAISGILGFIIGRRLSRFRESLFAGIFGGTLALLGAGAICFPKETSQNFRNYSFQAAKYAGVLYKKYCNKTLNLNDRLPCGELKAIKKKKRQTCPYKKPPPPPPPPPPPRKARCLPIINKK